MKKSNNNSKKGFTIIEVVLVLAIAGLIFLMVFVALPALQRSQRDTQRRQDMARLITAIQNYQSGNRNQVPTDFNGDKFYNGYLTNNGSDTFNDPSTNSGYTFASKVVCTATECVNGSNPGNNNPNAAMGVIVPYTNATCNGSDPMYAQGDGKLAFTIKLEGAGTYCTNN